MRKQYLLECKHIQENCTYTAESHHILSDRGKRLGIWFQLVPTVIAAILASLVMLQMAPLVVNGLTVIAAVVSAVANVLNPLKDYYDHLNAAKNFTALKHDARALHELFSGNMNDKDFALAVETLHNRYNDLIRFVPPTDSKAFEEARKRIKEGIHEPDFK
ncbi:MAG TPA: SLATT domain-containing protein [Candidatus Wunengus sp. YC60]|uniref:SLATT domain-containing protein n=1 Tax=Candidatus Wunengus sp. YC60 TaxID=3367697 RepID=UPI004024F70A